MLTTRPRGTNDLLPAELVKWHYVENILHQVASLYGYQEIRTPIFEHTELFQRGVGESTDIVEKEMYTFIDRGERSLTLRPEATASTVRAFWSINYMPVLYRLNYIISVLCSVMTDHRQGVTGSFINLGWKLLGRRIRA